MLKNKEITKEAREILKGKWLKTFGLLLVAVFIIGVASLIGDLPSEIEGGLGMKFFAMVFSVAIGFLVINPLAVGTVYIITSTGLRRDAHFSDLFRSFQGKGYWKDVFVYLVMDIVYSVLTGIAAIPFAVSIFSSVFSISNANLSIAEELAKSEDFKSMMEILIWNDATSTLLVGLLLTVILICVLLFFATPFVNMLYFTVSENRELNFSQCFKRAFALTRGNIIKYWLLSCHFIGWYLLSIIPVIITTPLWLLILSDTAGLFVIGIFTIISFTVFSLVIIYNIISNVVLYREIEKKLAEEPSENKKNTEEIPQQVEE